MNVYKFKRGKNDRVIAYDDNGKICLCDKRYDAPTSGEYWLCDVMKKLDKLVILKPIDKVDYEDYWQIEKESFSFYKIEIKNKIDGKTKIVAAPKAIDKTRLQKALEDLYEGDANAIAVVFEATVRALPRCAIIEARRLLADYIDLFKQGHEIRCKKESKAPVYAGA